MNPKIGLEGMLEYGSHKHSIWGSIKNVFTAFVVTLIWTILMTLFLRVGLGIGLNEIRIMILAQMSIYTKIPAAIGSNPLAMFFFACVLAPLWEEAVFRYAPFKIARSLESVSSCELFGYLPKTTCLFPAMVMSSIIFGLMHGGVVNIMFQGFTGMFLAWVMVKSGYPYAVLAHSLWNFMLMFGMPVLINTIGK